MTRKEAQAEAVKRWGKKGVARRVHWKDGYEWLVGYAIAGGWMWVGRSRVSYAHAFENLLDDSRWRADAARP